MKSTRQVMREADELDARRRHQIQNQVSTINRLLNGGTYEDEIEALHEELAAAQADYDKLVEELKQLATHGDVSGLREKLVALLGESAP